MGGQACVVHNCRRWQVCSIAADDCAALPTFTVHSRATIDTMDALEQEVRFDLHLAQNALGQQFGRPAILIKATSRRIGHCVFLPRLCTPAELYPVSAQSAPAVCSSIEVEIGWAISDRYRNQGYATEAAQALVAYGCADLGLARLVAFTDKANAASLKVMQKLGMRIGHCRGTDEMIGVIEKGVSR
jgi:RimJ/RimL family protein N-acetyltransferase